MDAARHSRRHRAVSFIGALIGAALACAPLLAATPVKAGYLLRLRQACELLRRDVPRQAEDEFICANFQDYAEPLGWIGIGAAQLAQGRVDSAMERFTQASALAANRSEQAQAGGLLARLGRAICLLQRGEVTKGRVELAALSQAGFSAALAPLAWADLECGDRSAAQEHVAQALAWQPDDALALAVKARVTGGVEGVRLMRRALELCPGSPYAAPQSGLALPNPARARSPREVSLVRVEIKYDPDRRATVTWLGQEQPEYITLTFDGREVGLSNTPPHEFGLPRDPGPGTHGIAVEVWGDGVVLGRGGAFLQVQGAGQPPNRYDGAEYAAALEALRSALTAIPNRVHLHYWLAGACAEMGQRQNALQSYERVVAMDPAFADARQRMISLCSALGIRGSTRPLPAVAASKRVCLTFDDGPSPMLTEHILDWLRAAKVRATFFVVGAQARAHPGLLRAIAAAGHELANHTYSHDDMTAKTPAEFQQELLATQVVVEEATGQRPRWWRPPGGRHTQAVRAAAAAIGYTTALWSANVSVCAGLPTQQGLRRLLDEIKPGAIVLLHNGPDETLSILPGLLTALKNRGYTFCTLSEATGR
jgi:peptidoglycan/xylan/chitin deacetylase (PgdA/CDA1 family)